MVTIIKELGSSIPTWVYFLLLFIFTVVIDITPIKWSPWKSLFTALGKILNKETNEKVDGLSDALRVDIQDVREDVNKLSSRVDQLASSEDEKYLRDYRWEIIDFLSRCQTDRKHRKGEWSHIIEIKSEYDLLLGKKNLKDPALNEDFKLLMEIYHECLKSNDFLPN